MKASSQNRTAPSKCSGASAYERGLDPDEAVQQPADQRALGSTRTPALPPTAGRKDTRRAVAGQHAEVDVLELLPAGLVGLVPVAEPVRHEVGMHGHEAGARIQREMQRRDVAEPEQGLRVGAHRVVVDQVEVTERHSAAGEREDRTHLRIAQQAVELPGDLAGHGGRPPPPPITIDQRRDAHHEPHPLDRLDPAFEQRGLVLVQPTGQGRHRDLIARP